MPPATLPLELPAPATADVRGFAQGAGLTVTVADWLWRCGQRPGEELARFLDPKLAHLTAPDEMVDRERAAQRLATAIRQRQTVAIFGDYDCDGITSTAIMTEVLTILGGRATPLLASRFAGGYGVSSAAVARILELEPQVLVTCDCGSSDHDSLQQISQRGIDVIVIDHHLVPERPLPAVAFLNPHRPECGYPYKGLASCGLALSVAAALRKELGTSLDVRQWLDLVAIGTVADVAPLDGDNRALVRAGLAALSNRTRPGVRALMELAKLGSSAPLTGRDVAFRLAPRINAPGRMGPPDLALRLLLAPDDATATALAAEVEQLSLSRRQAQERMAEEAVADIDQHKLDRGAAIVVGRQGWNHGIVGIVAGRLSERYGLPVCVLAFDGAFGRGSLRGPPGVRLHDALTRVSDVVTRFGGHQAAAGVEVEHARYEEFRERFDSACQELGSVPGPSVRARELTRLDPGDSLENIAADLARLEPCGERNPRPAVCFTGRIVSRRAVKGGHLKLEFKTERGQTLGAFAVGLGEQVEDFQPGADAVVAGDLRPDTWRGGDAVELLVEHLRPAGS